MTNQLALEEHEIEVRLNKLILQEEGEGYDWQQDTEKSNGKFGSLMIHFPSYHEGGDFFIKHDRTVIKSIYNQQKGENGFFYSAFYSDCFHKLNTITKGHRFTLLFDLVTKNSSGTNISIINVNTEAKHKLEQFIHRIRAYKGPIIYRKPIFIFPLDYRYSDENCLLQGRDREKISLLQNMKDENGNDLFFIALGSSESNLSCESTFERKQRKQDDKFGSITYLPHSFFKNPANFTLKINDAKRLFNTLRDTCESLNKHSFALIWLTDHHFPIVSAWYDITDDICELVQSHPDYGNKYLDDVITNRNADKNAVAKSTLLLRDKNRFLRAIACEPPEDTETFYKIISDSVENGLVTWNEVIPQIGRFMGKFDNNQAKFFSDIKDTNAKLNLFNEIRKSANFKPSGLHSWLDAHKEVDCSIDYIFQIFYRWDNDLNIELFIYCLNHQLFQKALECGKYLCSNLDPIFRSISENNFYSRREINFYDKIVSNFIKLNDYQCLRKLVEYLITNEVIDLKQVREKTLYYKEQFWHTFATSRIEQTSKLIPYIFEFLGADWSISDKTLFNIFNIMNVCAKEKFFISPRQYYLLLFKRINFTDLKKIDRFTAKKQFNLDLKEFAQKIILMGDESIHKSFATIFNIEYWADALKCKFTPPFSNILCDNYLTRTGVLFRMSFFNMSICLLKGNIDDIRLNNLLLACPSNDIKSVIHFADAVINCGRANDCDLCSVLAGTILKNVIDKYDKFYILTFLISVIRNDDIGEKFLQAIDIKVAKMLIF